MGDEDDRKLRLELASQFGALYTKALTVIQEAKRRPVMSAAEAALSRQVKSAEQFLDRARSTLA